MWGFADLCFIPNQDWGEGVHPRAGRQCPARGRSEKKPKKCRKSPKPTFWPILENPKNHHRGFRLGWGRRQCFRLNSKVKISRSSILVWWWRWLWWKTIEEVCEKQNKGVMREPHAMPEAANAEARNGKYSRDDQMFKPYWERAMFALSQQQGWFSFFTRNR